MAEGGNDHPLYAPVGGDMSSLAPAHASSSDWTTWTLSFIANENVAGCLS